MSDCNLPLTLSLAVALKTEQAMNCEFCTGISEEYNFHCGMDKVTHSAKHMCTMQVIVPVATHEQGMSEGATITI